MKPIYYFAYGSNMDMEQMRRRCPDAKRIDTAVLHGWKFALDEVGVCHGRSGCRSECAGAALDAVGCR